MRCFSAFKTGGLALSAVLLAAAMGAAHAPTPPAHAAAATPAAHKPATPGVLNPHLHIPATTTTAKTAPTKPEVAGAAAHSAATTQPAAGHATPSMLLAHHSPGPKWDAHAFVALHNGVSTIHGQVLNPNGTPAANARVALRKPGGGIFRIVGKRHVTYTSASGTFTMTNVPPGGYRVFSIQAKKHGFTKIDLHAGSTESVVVKI